MKCSFIIGCRPKTRDEWSMNKLWEEQQGTPSPRLFFFFARLPTKILLWLFPTPVLALVSSSSSEGGSCSVYFRCILSLKSVIKSSTRLTTKGPLSKCTSVMFSVAPGWSLLPCHFLGTGLTFFAWQYKTIKALVKEVCPYIMFDSSSFDDGPLLINWKGPFWILGNK